MVTNCYDLNMSTKTVVFIGMFVGSCVGGYIPVFLGASFLSVWSLVGNAIGGILGIAITYKLVSNNM